MILFILGPSGAGKSKFGAYLARQGWLHLEIDRFPDDGINLENLRDEWDAFWDRREPTRLTRELTRRARGKKGCVLTFPSGVVPSPEHLQVCAGRIVVAILYGSAADCVASFLVREKETGRGLTADHWLSNNGASYLTMSLPAFKQYRVAAFTARGSHRSYKAILGDISKR